MSLEVLVVALNPVRGAKESGFLMLVKVTTKLLPAAIGVPILVTLNCWPDGTQATA